MSNYKETKRAIKDKDGNIKGYQKCIIADMEHLTVGEKQIIEMYMKTGEYKIIPKKERKNNGKSKGLLSKENITKYLKENDEKGLKEFNEKLKNKENYMSIMTWFKKEYSDYIKKAQ